MVALPAIPLKGLVAIRATPGAAMGAQMTRRPTAPIGASRSPGCAQPGGGSEGPAETGAQPSLLTHHGAVLSDYDFHLDETTVRDTNGRSSAAGGLAVTEAIYDGAVLRHYSFADHWFKINVTTDLAGKPIETGAADRPRTSSRRCCSAVSSLRPRREAQGEASRSF